MQSITIDKRYCGPPNSANGGYVCGMLARAIGRSAEITLRAPPPLGRPLEIVTGADGAAELRDQQIVLATGRPVQLDVAETPAASVIEAKLRRAGRLMRMKILTLFRVASSAGRGAQPATA